MNLGDYIGDTRTDSLPPGFLKSIKIKYRHEASHVFTSLQPWKNEKDTKHCESLVDETSHRRDLSKGSIEEGGVQSKEQNVPSFMNWRVPSRLLNQKYDKTLVVDKTEGSGKAKSASFASRHTTATTVRSLTSTCLKRNEKSARQKKPERKTEDTSQEKSHNTKEDNYKTSSGKSSIRSKCSNKDEKQRRRSEAKFKSVNSNILKPIELKLDEKNATEFKAKEDAQNKTESPENSENLNKQRTDQGTKMKKYIRLKSQENVQTKNSGILKSRKEKIPDVNGGMKVDERVKSEEGGKKMNAKNDSGIDGKTFSNRSLKHVVELKELPKMKGLVSECTQNSPKKKNASLPVIKLPSENRASIKLSHTPERMDKIFDWVSKSTGREREAAFNLLSTYNKKIEAKTAKKKERVGIALQVLERKRISDPIESLHLNNAKRNPTALSFDQRATERHSSHVDKKEMEGKKTWHHIAMYKHVDSSNNRTAMFVQASNPDQHHFSIHPEWGLHTSVKFTNALTT